MKINEPPVIVEQKFKFPLETLWNAITDVNEMRQWFFNNIPAFKPVVGFITEFDVSVENRLFLHQWEITKVIPLKVIEYNWKYKDYQGDSYVTFELSKLNEYTQLTLKTRVVEDFQDSIPEFTRESCLQGWNYFIKSSLSNYLINKSS